MQVSKNFKLEEFYSSQTARQMGINNTPDLEAVVNLTRLCDNVMQVIRNHFAAPVYISSAYRCKKLNDAIGGALNSQHLTGQAADFTVGGNSVSEVFRWCKANLDYDQLILEKGLWVHISFNLYKNRHESLIYDGISYKKA